MLHTLGNTHVEAGRTAVWPRNSDKCGWRGWWRFQGCLGGRAGWSDLGSEIREFQAALGIDGDYRTEEGGLANAGRWQAQFDKSCLRGPGTSKGSCPLGCQKESTSSGERAGQEMDESLFRVPVAWSSRWGSIYLGEGLRGWSTPGSMEWVQEEGTLSEECGPRCGRDTKGSVFSLTWGQGRLPRVVLWSKWVRVLQGSLIFGNLGWQKPCLCKFSVREEPRLQWIERRLVRAND